MPLLPFLPLFLDHASSDTHIASQRPHRYNMDNRIAHPAAQLHTGTSSLQLRARHNHLLRISYDHGILRDMGSQEWFEKRYQLSKSDEHVLPRPDVLPGLIRTLSLFLQVYNVQLPDHLTGDLPGIPQLSSLPDEIQARIVGEVIRSSWPTFPILKVRYGVGDNGIAMRQVLTAVLPPFLSSPTATQQSSQSEPSFAGKLFTMALKEIFSTMTCDIRFPGHIMDPSSADRITRDWARVRDQSFLRQVQSVKMLLAIGAFRQTGLHRPASRAIMAVHVHFLLRLKEFMPQLRKVHLVLHVNADADSPSEVFLTAEEMRTVSLGPEPADPRERTCWELKHHVMFILQALRDSGVDRATMAAVVCYRGMPRMREGRVVARTNEDHEDEETVSMMLNYESGERPVFLL